MPGIQSHGISSSGSNADAIVPIGFRHKTYDEACGSIASLGEAKEAGMGVSECHLTRFGYAYSYIACLCEQDAELGLPAWTTYSWFRKRRMPALLLYIGAI